MQCHVSHVGAVNIFQNSDNSDNLSLSLDVQGCFVANESFFFRFSSTANPPCFRSGKEKSKSERIEDEYYFL